MCGLRTRPRRTDVDPPRFLYRTAIGRGHIVSLPRGDSLSVIFIANLYQSSKIKFVSDLFQIGGSAFVFFDILLKWAEPISLQISDLVSVRDLLTEFRDLCDSHWNIKEFPPALRGASGVDPGGARGSIAPNKNILGRECLFAPSKF